MIQKTVNFYERHYKWITLIPFVLLLLGIGQLVYQANTTGDIVQRGISLAGGSALTVEVYSVPTLELQSYLSSAFPTSEIIVRELASPLGQTGYIIEADANTNQEELLVKTQEKLGELQASQYSIEVTAATLADQFFVELMWALVIAFVLMGVVIFIAFRKVVPSVAIILSAFTDLILTIAIFNLMGGRLTTAGVAALLLVIGYSVDTNVLLTNHMLKRTEATILQRIKNAFQTGWVMILTTVASVVAGLFLTNSDAIKEMMLILFIGLVIDTMTTWVQNAGMLKWFMERVK